MLRRAGAAVPRGDVDGGAGVQRGHRPAPPRALARVGGGGSHSVFIWWVPKKKPDNSPNTQTKKLPNHFCKSQPLSAPAVTPPLGWDLCTASHTPNVSSPLGRGGGAGTWGGGERYLFSPLWRHYNDVIVHKG